MPPLPASLPACHVLTPQGLRLALTLDASLPLTIFAAESLRPAAQHASPSAPIRWFASLPELIRREFHHFPAHIFLTAAGIAVRCIAPHVRHKSTDPAVLVLDQYGRFAIPLLSGHWGGGNALARTLAGITGGEAVLTTATDTAGLPAIDELARAHDCAIADWGEIRHVSAALLREHPVPLLDPHGILPKAEASPRWFPRVAVLPTAGPAICVDWRSYPARPGLLRLIPRRLALGVGCRRGVDADTILAAIHAAFTAAELAPEACRALASIDAKRHEAGLLDAAARLGLPCVWHTAAELAACAVPHPSPRAERVFSAPGLGVCEGAALCAAGPGARLVLPKLRFRGCVTVAIARAAVRTAHDPTAMPGILPIQTERIC